MAGKANRQDALRGDDESPPVPPGACPCCGERLEQAGNAVRCPACDYPDNNAAWVDYDGCA